jgi:hypothetical protein
MVRNNTGVYVSKITGTYILLPGLKKSLMYIFDHVTWISAYNTNSEQKQNSERTNIKNVNSVEKNTLLKRKDGFRTFRQISCFNWTIVKR